MIFTYTEFQINWTFATYLLCSLSKDTDHACLQQLNIQEDFRRSVQKYWREAEKEKHSCVTCKRTKLVYLFDATYDFVKA